MAQQQRADEQARQARINTGMSSIDSTFSGFDDNFYKNRQQAYIDYAMPEVQRQAAAAHRALVYALARNGNLDSSGAIRKDQDLTTDTNKAALEVGNQALDQSNQTRSQIENIRSGIVAQLNATGDDQAAANSALRQTQNLNMPQGFSPMGQMFSDFLSGVSQIGSNDANGYSGFVGGRPLFGSSRGSSRVVGG
jgi:hypothetical protein